MSAKRFAQLITKTISGTFGIGKIDNLKVVINERDGFCNGTKFCIGAGKRYPDWYKNKKTRAVFESVAELLGVPVESLFYEINDGDRRTWGTYVHPDILIQVAQWCSSDYAAKVSQIMRKLHIQEMKEMREEQERLKGKVDRKRNKISKLDELLAETRQARKEARAEAKRARLDASKKDHQLEKLKAEADRVLLAIGYVQTQNESLESHLVDVKRKLFDASKNKVVPTSNENDGDVIAIVDNGSIYIPADADSEDSEQLPPHESSVIRAAKGNVSAMLRRIVKEYPEAEIVYRFSNPNAVMSWKRYLERYGKYLIRSHGKFSFVEGYTRVRFLRHLKRCDGEKMKGVEK